MTALTDTPSWQLPVLPSVPEYWRCTPPSGGRPWGSRCRPPPTPSVRARREAARPGGGGPAASPTGWWHEVVQRLIVHLPAQAGGHRLDRLAPAVQHQPPQVALTVGTLVLARQRLEHLGGERLQTSADRGQLGRCDPRHPVPSTQREGRIRSHPNHHRQT